MTFRNAILVATCTTVVGLQSSNSQKSGRKGRLANKGSIMSITKKHANIFDSMNQSMKKTSSKQDVKIEEVADAPVAKRTSRGFFKNKKQAEPQEPTMKIGDKVRFEGSPTNPLFKLLPDVYGTIVKQYEKSVEVTDKDDENFDKWIVRVAVDQDKPIPDVLMKKKCQCEQTGKETVLVCANAYRFTGCSDESYHAHVFGEQNFTNSMNPLARRSINMSEESSAEPQQATM